MQVCVDEIQGVMINILSLMPVLAYSSNAYVRVFVLHACTCMRAFLCACACMCMHVYVRACVHVCAQWCACVYAHFFVCLCVLACLFGYVFLRIDRMIDSKHSNRSLFKHYLNEP